MRLKYYSFDNKREKAKVVPLTDLYPDELREVGRTFRGRCPFHDDQLHPNFYVYPKTNSWFCFAGCGGGDNINFYMRLKKIGFKEAIEELAR